jgi:cardiolipin synthase
MAAGLDQAQLYVEPDDGSGPIVQFIGSARQSLDVAMYLLSDKDVIAALESAEKRGVKVRMMLEEHPYETGSGNKAVEAQLRAAKILTNWSPGTFALSHDKYAVADNRTALVGTPNWTHSAFVSNREYFLVVSGPTEVTQLEALFNSDWSRQAAQLDDAKLVVSPINSRSDFVALIRSAKSTIELEAEEMQDPAIEAELGQSAQRGVVVRAVLAAGTGGPDANATGRVRLTGAGVQVRTLRNPYIHAKIIVVDDREAFVGSENISTASLDHNREVGLLVANTAVVGRLESTFGEDWTSAARP